MNMLKSFRRGMRAVTGIARTAYGASDRVASEVAAWSPRRGSAEALLRAERPEITARGRDLMRNSGFAVAGVQREIDAVLGASFRPVPNIDAGALGIDRDEAARIQREIVAAWRDYSDHPLHIADVGRRHSVGALIALAYRHYLVDGDALAVLHWRESPAWSTRIRIADPDLLSTPDTMDDGPRLQSGVETDSDGAPVAYHIRRAPDDIDDPEAYLWDRVPRETPWGRPVVVHFFDCARDGQRRGVSAFTPVMEAFRQEDRYARAELQAAILNAVLGLFITSPFDESLLDALGSDAGTMSAYQDLRGAYGKKAPVQLDGVSINRLFPGEDIQTLGQRQLNQFEAFEAGVLRRIAAGLGLSYEQLANDWTKTTYSSARAAMLEIWRGWERKRVTFAKGFCAPIYLAWLEEAVDRGRVVLPEGAPGIMDAPALWCRAKWIGPGRGFVDPVKEAQAAQLRIALGIATQADEAAALTGRDLDEVRAELAREIAETPVGMIHPASRDWVEAFGRVPLDNSPIEGPGRAPSSTGGQE